MTQDPISKNYASNSIQVHNRIDWAHVQWRKKIGIFTLLNWIVENVKKLMPTEKKTRKNSNGVKIGGLKVVSSLSYDHRRHLIKIARKKFDPKFLVLRTEIHSNKKMMFEHKFFWVFSVELQIFCNALNCAKKTLSVGIADSAINLNLKSVPKL